MIPAFAFARRPTTTTSIITAAASRQPSSIANVVDDDDDDERLPNVPDSASLFCTTSFALRSYFGLLLFSFSYDTSNHLAKVRWKRSRSRLRRRISFLRIVPKSKFVRINYDAAFTKRTIRESPISGPSTTGRRSILRRCDWRAIYELRVSISSCLPGFFRFFSMFVLCFSDFFKRTILLNSLVWTCGATGRSGLTYEVKRDLS